MGGPKSVILTGWLYISLIKEDCDRVDNIANCSMATRRNDGCKGLSKTNRYTATSTGVRERLRGFVERSGSRRLTRETIGIT